MDHFTAPTPQNRRRLGQFRLPAHSRKIRTGLFNMSDSGTEMSLALTFEWYVRRARGAMEHQLELVHGAPERWVRHPDVHVRVRARQAHWQARQRASRQT